MVCAIMPVIDPNHLSSPTLYYCPCCWLRFQQRFTQLHKLIRIQLSHYSHSQAPVTPVMISSGKNGKTPPAILAMASYSSLECSMAPLLSVPPMDAPTVSHTPSLYLTSLTDIHLQLPRKFPTPNATSPKA